MKKNNTLKIIVSMLLLTALMTGTAFAAVGQPAAEKEQSNIETLAKNKLVSGKVESVKAEKDFTTIAITNEDIGMVFHAKAGVFVIDQKTADYLKLEDIKVGMKITAILDKISPMTYSIPPQTNGAIGFIINDEVGGINLSVFDSDLLNFEKDLKLNISKETQIVNVKGTKQMFMAEDLKNAELLVLSKIMATSMPAQTTPEFVMILNTAEELKAKPAETVVPSTVVDQPKAVQYVSLRTGAEAAGYTVKWTSNSAPIILTKNDMKIELNVGSDQFTFTHMTKDIKPLDNMKKLDVPAKLEGGKTMVPETFIMAL